MEMNSVDNQSQASKLGRDPARAIRTGVGFAVIGGLAIPLAFWAIMYSSMSLLGADIGLEVRVIAGSFLSMVWPTSVILIAPGLGLGIIAALLLINAVVWGAIGFLSEKFILRPLPYYGLLALLVLGLLVSNGAFIWIAIESSKFVPNLIYVPSFVVAAISAVALFILRRRRALIRSQLN